MRVVKASRSCSKYHLSSSSLLAANGVASSSRNAIWKGPIVGNDGKEMLASGTTADDKFLGGINFFVKGVEGKVPGADKK